MVTCRFVDCCGWHLRTRNLATSRNPSPGDDRIPIGIGNVGFVRDGRFDLLFPAGSPLGQKQLGKHVPATFQLLDVGSSVPLEPRLPGCLHTKTVRPLGSSSGTATYTSYVLPFELFPAILRKSHPGSRNVALILHSSSPAIVVQHW